MHKLFVTLPTGVEKLCRLFIGSLNISQKRQKYKHSQVAKKGAENNLLAVKKSLTTWPGSCLGYNTSMLAKFYNITEASQEVWVSKAKLAKTHYFGFNFLIIFYPSLFLPYRLKNHS